VRRSQVGEKTGGRLRSFARALRPEGSTGRSIMRAVRIASRGPPPVLKTPTGICRGYMRSSHRSSGGRKSAPSRASSGPAPARTEDDGVATADETCQSACLAIFPSELKSPCRRFDGHGRHPAGCSASTMLLFSYSPTVLN